MLTVDLVRARVRGRELVIATLKGKTKARARHLAESFLEVARAHIGETRGAVDAAFDAVVANPRERKLALGLRKLIEDECLFEADESVDARALRKQVFQRASSVRQSLAHDESFDREALLEAIAGERELGESPAELLASLYADLREAHVLVSAPTTLPTTLVERYELAQAQAALLRATRVVANIECSSATTYRYILGKLKFRRLLHTIRRQGSGYRVEIDGPYSLFSSVTKYGLQLALLLPAFELCDSWELKAELLWGKERRPLDFFLSGGRAKSKRARARGAADPKKLLDDLPDEARQLVESFKKIGAGWTVDPSAEILELPGLGICVPDLSFVHESTGKRIFLEVMGFWSREAVWRRVELVEGGLKQRIIFAVPKRLRVSEEVLGDDLPGSLYVYKGKMNAKAILQRLEGMVS